MGEEKIKLPGLDCGLCGFKSCHEFSEKIEEQPEIIKRCIYIKKDVTEIMEDTPAKNDNKEKKWQDSFGREFDFYLEKFPDDPGPKEIIHPFNVSLIKELGLKKGDIIIGRPMAAGCPVTHCGQIESIDTISGLICWHIVGPLVARNKPLIDIGSYSPQAFEGIVKETRAELKIGMRYNWMPRYCMIQWRHSGLITAMTKKGSELIVRIEGVMLG
jgi:uncharacterized Fe-S cluster-containing protein